MRFENPPIPFSTPVHHIRDGSEIEIHGMAFDGAVGSFAVELFVGNDIALHLNPRQKHHGNTIVLNSMVMGQWQHEERHHGPIHHFHHNKHFHLKIIVHQHHFKIKVNDHKICEFHHRMPYHMINMIGIRNDVVVHKIHLHNVGEGYGAPMPGYVQPMPIGSGVAPQPYIGGGVVPPPVYAPPPTVYMPPQPVMAYGAQPSVVVIEEGHRHHHHGIFGHHHHHHW
uniref:Galectin n=1 Tax=Acrobeloides nanus TaxID=290746 RepID=A0A914DNY6_9BILA